MDVYLGKSGIKKGSFQEPFPEVVKCHKCRAIARIMFVAAEGSEPEELICHLHKNEKGKYWVHDSCAIAVYLCEKCFEPNALINQA